MRLIDADKLIYSNIKTNGYGYVEVIETVVLEEDIANAQTVEAIPIPRGATNGDMIKAMFPCEEEECVNSIDHRTHYGGLDFLKGFNTDWWNAPYERM